MCTNHGEFINAGCVGYLFKHPMSTCSKIHQSYQKLTLILYHNFYIFSLKKMQCSGLAMFFGNLNYYDMMGQRTVSYIFSPVADRPVYTK